MLRYARFVLNHECIVNHFSVEICKVQNFSELWMHSWSLQCCIYRKFIQNISTWIKAVFHFSVPFSFSGTKLNLVPNKKAQEIRFGLLLLLCAKLNCAKIIGSWLQSCITSHFNKLSFIISTGGQLTANFFAGARRLNRWVWFQHVFFYHKKVK